ncbi:DUF2334 domain-containing protein [Paenibacillus beijingensis]|uniref:DUF2334 domain-containing protein n=1 Tax=Paenibacillus beijingensis TaxID=1126833 RepID=UPI0006987FC3|nr:DUF2334 domain-containing protein [Paenibacillus beijingensis]
MAMIRLEDIGPGGYYESAENQTKLTVVADYLQSEGIPFQVAVISRYIDPTRGIDRALTDRTDSIAVRFVQTLHALVKRGASLGMHGYTHQFGKAVSADGYEFHYADCSADCPPDDSQEALSRPKSLRHSYAYGRFTAALRMFQSTGLRPDWFETPHYAASAIQRSVLEACSGIMYETNPSAPHSRTVTVRASHSPLSGGSLYVPTPLFYVGGAAIEDDVQRIAEAIRSYGDHELASFFYHPFLEFPYIRLQEGASPVYEQHSPLKRLIRAFKGAGRKFLSIPDVLTFIPDFRETGLFGGKDYRIMPVKSGNGRGNKLLVRQYSTGIWSIAEVNQGSRNKMENGIRNIRTVLTGWPSFAAGEELIGDFNGDGRDDIAIWHSESGVCPVALHSGTTLLPDGNWLAAGERFKGWRALAGDWNGDGLTDLALWDPRSGHLATAYNETGKFQFPVRVSEEPLIGKNRSPYIGDVNGDGLDDLVLWDRSSGSWEVWLNDGVEFQWAGVWLAGHAIENSSCALLADVNGDGRADLLLVNRKTGYWSVAFSTGKTFVLRDNAFGPWAPGADTVPLAVDFHGNGRAGLLAIIPGRYGGTLDAAVNALNWHLPASNFPTLTGYCSCFLPELQ